MMMLKRRKEKQPEIRPENECDRENDVGNNDERTSAPESKTSDEQQRPEEESQTTSPQATTAAATVSSAHPSPAESLPAVSSSPDGVPQQSPVVSVSSGMASPLSSPVSPPATSFPGAFRRACIANKTFTLTPKQVLKEEQHIQVPRHQDSSILLYQDNDSIVAKAIVDNLNLNKSVPCSSSSSWSGLVYSGVAGAASIATKVASTGYKWAVSDPDDYEDADLDYQEQGDNNDHVNNEPPLKMDERIVCVDLVSECIKQLLPHCKEMRALVRHGTDEYSFAAWTAPYSPLVDGLQQRDLDLLEHVLVEAGHAVFYDLDGKRYIIVLESDKAPTEVHVQAAATLAHGKQSIAAQERLIERWSEEADECTRLAIVKKNQGDKEGALRQLRKRKHLELKLENARAALLNLEQVTETLETSRFQNSHVMRPLEATAKAMKALREELTVEDVDEIMLDLQEEIRHVNEMGTVAHLASAIGQQEADDDEALSAELTQLFLEDDEPATEDKDIVKENHAESPAGTDEAAKDGEVAKSNRGVSESQITNEEQVSQEKESTKAASNGNSVAVEMPAE